MSDLQISAAILNDLRTTLSNISANLDGACRLLRNANNDAVGADPLVSRLHDFGHDWNYGIGQIGQHADDCLKMLDQVGQTFDDLDGKLKNQVTAKAQ